MDKITELLNTSIHMRKNKFVTEGYSQSQSYHNSDQVIQMKSFSSRCQHRHDQRRNSKSKETIRRPFKFLTETQSSSSFSSPFDFDQSSSFKKKGSVVADQKISSDKSIKVNQIQANLSQAIKQQQLDKQKVKNPQEENQK